MSRHRSSLSLFAGLLLIVGAARQAHSQVIQVGAAGEITVFDAPAVFAASGVSPIVLQRPHRVRQGRSLGRSAPSDLTSAAREADLSPALIEAVARQESGLRAGVVSSAGAIGEMQLMPATARALGVDPRVTRENYRGGAGYLRVLMSRYDGDVVLALAAYNAGPGAVDRYGGPPPYKQTQAYVAAVLERLGRRAAEEDEVR